MYIRVSTPPPTKAPPLFLAKAPPRLKTAKCPSPHFLGNSPLYIVFFRESPLKSRFFSEPQKFSCFSSLTPCYLLKITKFLVKVSQFEFFGMTEKNVFVYKLFLSLNISDFSLSLMKKLYLPLEKVIPFFPTNPL